jgi:hypothetical protein
MEYFAAGDTIDIRGKQTSGGNLQAKSGTRVSFMFIAHLNARQWAKYYADGSRTLSSNALTAVTLDLEQYNPAGIYGGSNAYFATNGPDIYLPDGYHLYFMGLEPTGGAVSVGGALCAGSMQLAGTNVTLMGKFFNASQLFNQYSALGFGPKTGPFAASGVQGGGRMGFKFLWRMALLSSQTNKAGANVTRAAFWRLGPKRLWACFTPGGGVASTSQSYTSGTTFTVYTALAASPVGSAQPYDNITISSGVVTLPRTGKWLIFAYTNENGPMPNSATGRRGMQIDYNSGTVLAQQVRDGNALADQHDQLAAVVNATAADTVRIMAFQNSGSTVSLAFNLLVIYLGP